MNRESYKPKGWDWLIILCIVPAGLWSGWNEAKKRQEPKSIQEQIREESSARNGMGFRQAWPPDIIWDELSSLKEWGEEERQKCRSQKEAALALRLMEQYWQWTDLEARHGNTESAILLGVTLYEGKLLPQDKKKALEWFKLAAQSNDPTAMELRDALLAEFQL